MAVAGDLIDQLMHLPADDRADLARRLLVSLEGAEVDPNLDESWEAEIERRLAAFDRGESKAVDWREAVERARAAMDPRIGRPVPDRGKRLAFRDWT